MENEKLIIDAVTVLANKLGTTGTHLWEVLIKQAPISCIISLTFFIIGIILAFLGLRVTFNIYKLAEIQKVKDLDLDLCAAAIYIIGAISFLLTIILLFNIDSISLWISGIFNPEYWALNQVTHMFK